MQIATPTILSADDLAASDGRFVVLVRAKLGTTRYEIGYRQIVPATLTLPSGHTIPNPHYRAQDGGWTATMEPKLGFGSLKAARAAAAQLLADYEAAKGGDWAYWRGRITVRGTRP